MATFDSVTLCAKPVCHVSMLGAQIVTCHRVKKCIQCAFSVKHYMRTTVVALTLQEDSGKIFSSFPGLHI